MNMNINNGNLSEANNLDLDTGEIKQLAQITINGVYRYEMYWKPGTNEVAIETVDSSSIGWQSDTLTVGETMFALLNVDIDDMRITGLGFFGLHDDDYHFASPDEYRDIYTMQWNRIGEDGYAVQFNINVGCEYDDGSAPPRHIHSEELEWREYRREEREEASYREPYDEGWTEHGENVWPEREENVWLSGDNTMDWKRLDRDMP